MVVRGITDFFSTLATHFSTSIPSTSVTSTTHQGTIQGQRNNFPSSSPLRDLSAYSYHDPESTDRVPPHSLLLGENGVNSFSKEKGLLLLPTNSLFTTRKWVRLTATLCFILLSIILAFLFFLNPNPAKRDSKFYVVLDCGSTGTRIYIYQEAGLQPRNLPIKLKSFPDHFRKKSGPHSGRAYNRMETEPGLDKLVHNISGLRIALNPLLKWAEKQIPKSAHGSTYLFLFATAGVRRLPIPDSEWLLENVWSVLKKSRFSCRRSFVRIISGMEEAYFGWVALNYQKGLLGAVPKKETYGALDLGGSSLQVTFETRRPVKNETSLSLTVGSSIHHLTAYSLSGYGLNDAFDRSVSRLLKIRLKKAPRSSVNNIVLHHPCLQTGFKEDYLCSHCISVSQEAGKRFEKDKMGIPLKLVGSPKWEECSALAKVTVNLSEWSAEDPGIDCGLRPCAISGKLPVPGGRFYAMSGFFVVFRFFNLSAEATLDEVLEKGREFCGKRWKVAKKSVPPQPFVEQYCFRAPYIALLLRQGLHITDRNVIIGSGSTTWTLGAVLLEAGKGVPEKTDIFGYELPQMRHDTILLSALLFMSLVLLFLALACIGKCVPRIFHRSCFFNKNNSSNTSVLGFPHWSPISSGDGRVKTPLSPTVNGSQQRPFGMVHSFSSGGSTQPFESSLVYPASTAGVTHSYSSGSLVQMQMQMESSSAVVGAFWTPHRSRLQSRRSQSREDLSSTVAETHLPNV